MKQTMGRKLAFGVGGLGKDLCYAMISTYLTIYLTDTVGLAPLFVGNLFLVARVWDAVNDPIMASSWTTPAPAGANSAPGSVSAPLSMR